jgi:hypothetical protein
MTTQLQLINIIIIIITLFSVSLDNTKTIWTLFSYRPYGRATCDFGDLFWISLSHKVAGRATRTGDYPASRTTAFKLRTLKLTSELSTLPGNQRIWQNWRLSLLGPSKGLRMEELDLLCCIYCWQRSGNCVELKGAELSLSSGRWGTSQTILEILNKLNISLPCW